GRSWLNHRHDGVEASSTPIIQSVTSVTQKISQALPRKTSSPALQPLSTQSSEPDTTSPPVSHKRTPQQTADSSNVMSDTGAVTEADAPAQNIGQPAQPEVLVRHGSSFAAAHKLATEDNSDPPVDAPLQVTEGANLQPKPEVLSNVVAAVPSKAPAPAPQVARAAVPAKLIHSVPAQYPAMARQLRVEGMVLLSVDVDTAGNVASVKALSGPPLLRQAAIDAVQRWKYEPASVNAQPVTSTQTVRVDFHWR
ncbi:MAG TPA: TonB family protein, partial [Terriglobales bacterium]|nr:TonB family protein [Terriglobales bacterium]